MKDNIFIDSNVIIYSFDKEEKKKNISIALLKANPIISIQVLNEISNILNKKFNMNIKEIKNSVDLLVKICRVKNIIPQTIKKALDIVDRYKYSYYDSLIISSALENKCSIIYTEDLHDSHVIDKKLKIINPFKND
jgi:predicted nucleic acid-binding protein